MLLAGWFAGSAQAAIVFSDGKWESSFNCSEWGYPQPLSCDGLTILGGWSCAHDNKVSQITTAANNPLGSGRGFRHWLGDYFQNGVAVSNDNSGPLGPVFETPQPELWIRWYLRFEAGMAWDDGTYTGTKPYPYYHKLLYIYTNGATQVIPGFVVSNNMALTAQATSDYYQVKTPSGAGDWARINGGNTGDGKFHLYEVHLKMDSNQTDGIGELWVDGALVASNYAVDWSAGDAVARQGWSYIKIGNNMAWAHSGRATFEDFDDVVIYNSPPPGRDPAGRPWIGPIGQPAPPAGLVVTEIVR